MTPRLWTASLLLRRPPGQSHHRARQRAGCISHHRAMPPDRTGGHHRASNGDQVWGVGRAGGTSWNSLASKEIPTTPGAVRAASGGGGPHTHSPTIGEGAKSLCAGRGGHGEAPYAFQPYRAQAPEACPKSKGRHYKPSRKLCVIRYSEIH